MKGNCTYCHKELDETEYMQNMGMCEKCFEEKWGTDKFVPNASFETPPTSAHLS